MAAFSNLDTPPLYPDILLGSPPDEFRTVSPLSRIDTPVGFESGVLMQLVQVTPQPTYIDLQFDAALAPLTLASADPSGWLFSGPVAVTATSLQVIGATLRIFHTEALGGAVYGLQFPAGGLRSMDGAIYGGAASITFVAVAISPVAVVAQVLSGTSVRVIFSEAVIESDALTVGNYSISPGPLAVFGVAKETDRNYILTTAAQTPGQNYLLTVINVRDLSQNPV